MKKKEKLPVILRMEKCNGGWTPLAVFPTTNNPIYCECYSHVGQHSEICRGYYNQDTKPATESEYEPLLYNQDTKPATESEYEPLLKELHEIGYTNLRIVKKWLDK